MKFKFIFILFVVTFVAANEKFICVSVVTQNNENTIWESLKSVIDIADCISICDLGSTDETKKRIEEFFLVTGIQGKIHSREATNKGDTTLMSAQVAQKTAKHFGYPPIQTYLLMLEPDQVIASASDAITKTLDDDAYMVLEKSQILSCYSYKPNLFKASIPSDKIRIMRNGNAWRTVKKFRNFVIEDQLTPFSLDTEDLSEKEKKDLFLKEYEQYKIEKLHRNISLFTEALKDDPDNMIFLLYLAQSHKSLKRFEEAISGYKACIDKGDDPEEIWFSKFMLGECYEEMGLWVHALYWYLEAYQYNPNRAESIRKIATYYRLNGQNEIAYMFARHGWRIPQKEDKNLFPYPPLQDYQFDEELSVAAYYTRFRDEGYTASNDLILRRDAPYYIKDQGYRNILFYVQNIKGRYQQVRLPLPYITEGSDEKYYPMNPSIQRTEDGYKVICRAVNFTQMGAKHFHTNDPDGIFRTKNFLVYFDKEFNQLTHQEIVEDLPREHHRTFIIEGLEDCRIVGFDDHSWFSCSTFDTNPSGAIQITLCKMENKGTEGPVKVEKFLPLIGPDPNRHEKNWLPFVKDNQLHFIYSSDPFTIYKPDLETGICETVFQYTPDYDFSRFRGSASPVPFDEGYLMLIHEVVQHPDYTRTYLHRFVYLNDDFHVEKVSKPFIFNHIGIEYCLSMTIDHENKHLVMPVGIEDREAFLAFVDLDEVRSLLFPLPNIYNPY